MSRKHFFITKSCVSDISSKQIQPYFIAVSVCDTSLLKPVSDRPFSFPGPPPPSICLVPLGTLVRSLWAVASPMSVFSAEEAMVAIIRWKAPGVLCRVFDLLSRGLDPSHILKNLPQCCTW